VSPGHRILVPFTGVVLAGGRSTRMGTDKAFLALPAPAGGPSRPLVTVAATRSLRAPHRSSRSVGTPQA
jgi:molybdopterin-guanine dinucleotide biosynthesis protein A